MTSDDDAPISDQNTNEAVVAPDNSPSESEVAFRPDNLPEKFWDEGEGAVRVDDLIKSYRELENQFASRSVSEGGPVGDFAEGTATQLQSPDDYAIDVANGPVPVDPVINDVLFEAGFNNDQVQVVYDIANQYFSQVAEHVRTEAMLDHQAALLEQHFGGPEKWTHVQDQIRTWADRHLPKDVVDQLSYSVNGVLTLQRLMAMEEPGVLTGVGGSEAGLSEDKLRERMKDPRYWRDHDPVLVREIQEGFERLYPDD